MQLDRFLAALACLLLPLPAAAILIRADRDDAEYLELATRYPSAVSLEPSQCGGVLIAPRWILTYTLAAEELERKKPRPRLRIGGAEHDVEAVYTQKWVGLLLLKSPVKGIAPSPLYRDKDEGGKALIIVSHGPSGRIGDTRRITDKRARAAINTVDGVSEPLLQLRIKPPEEASDLQGAALDEDCGSPAYIDNRQGIFVAGIASMGKSPPTVGESNLYIRVSTLVAWIDAVMLEVARKELDALLEPGGR